LCQTSEDDDGVHDHHPHYHHHHLHHHEELDSYGSPLAVPLDSYLGKDNIQNRFQSRNLCTLSVKRLSGILPQGLTIIISPYVTDIFSSAIFGWWDGGDGELLKAIQPRKAGGVKQVQNSRLITNFFTNIFKGTVS
jgi:hypothetical protein